MLGIFCSSSDRISLKFVDLTCFPLPTPWRHTFCLKKIETRKQLRINNGWDMRRLQQNVPHDITRRHEILNCVVIVIMSENMLPCVWNMILQQKKTNEEKKSRVTKEGKNNDGQIKAARTVRSLFWGYRLKLKHVHRLVGLMGYIYWFWHFTSCGQ